MLAFHTPAEQTDLRPASDAESPQSRSHVSCSDETVAITLWLRVWAGTVLIWTWCLNGTVFIFVTTEEEEEHQYNSWFWTVLFVELNSCSLCSAGDPTAKVQQLMIQSDSGWFRVSLWNVTCSLWSFNRRRRGDKEEEQSRQNDERTRSCSVQRKSL